MSGQTTITLHEQAISLHSHLVFLAFQPKWSGMTTHARDPSLPPKTNAPITLPPSEPTQNAAMLDILLFLLREDHEWLSNVMGARNSNSCGWLTAGQVRPYGVGTGLVMQNMVPAPNFEDEAVARTAGKYWSFGIECNGCTWRAIVLSTTVLHNRVHAVQNVPMIIFAQAAMRPQVRASLNLPKHGKFMHAVDIE
jgi:hypothetical protein